MNNRDVFVSDSIFPLIFFGRTRGFNLCGLTIEPSNYCAGKSPLIARSQTRKTANQIMIGRSRKVNSPIFVFLCFFSERIYAFNIWGITCYRKLVMRGFSQEDFKSKLAHFARKKKYDYLRSQFFLPKESP